MGWKNFPVIFVSVGIVVLFVVFGVTLYLTDALVFTGTDPSAKIVTATLALIGAFVAAVISLVGVLIKYSIDARTEARQQLESERNAVLAREAEDRLKLDTMIRAVQLFGHEGARALPVQRAGALMALCSLRQHDLALALVGDLLLRDDLEAATAAAIVDHVAVHGNDRAKIMAVEIFYENAHKFLTEGSYEVPRTFMNVRDESLYHVRQLAVLGLAKLLLARPISDWRGRYRPMAFGVVVALIRAWRDEPSVELKKNASTILGAVLDAFSFTPALRDADDTLDLTLIRAELSSIPASTSLVIQNLVSEFHQWRQSSSRSGAA